ncbi:branched-chain amino acid ABC transporter permease [Lachnospiraceae bacterium KGMB03038]|nr:branched-chain amino acid ABC transporter permease [Lachnospiraceae bacterium KGMB03038]
MVLQIIVNGLTMGCVYALIALGYSMVYGCLKFINFAHGDVFMWGACFGLIFARMGGIPFPLALILTMVCTGLLGVILEFLAYRRLRNVPRVVVTASALGASIVLSNLALVLVGAETYSVPPFFETQYFNIGDLVVNSLQLILLGCSIVLMLFLNWFINKSKWGKAIRATSENMSVASLMGINTNKIISVTFFIGSAFAGAAGLLIGIYYDAVYSTMGYMAGMKAFTAAVLGGIGSIPGAMIGSLILGLVESFGTTYISSSMGPAISFAILIIVLLVKPTGLIGTGDTHSNRV